MLALFKRFWFLCYSLGDIYTKSAGWWTAVGGGELGILTLHKLHTHLFPRGPCRAAPLYSLLGGMEWRESTGLGEQSHLHNYEQTVLHIAQNNHETFPNWGVPGMKNPRLTPMSADPSLEPCSREPGPPLESGLGGHDWNENEAGCPSSSSAPHQSSQFQQQREFTVRTEVQGVARRSPESHHFKAFSKGAPGCQSLQGPFLNMPALRWQQNQTVNGGNVTAGRAWSAMTHVLFLFIRSIGRKKKKKSARGP